MEKTMIEQDYFKIYEVGEGIYHIWEKPGVASSLVVGETLALLIDTGYGFSDLKKVVEQITPLPYRILNTHCHLDHAGGNYLFHRPVCINFFEKDVYDYYQKVQKKLILEKYQRDCGKEKLPWPEKMDIDAYLKYKTCQFCTLQDGEVFELGGRKVTAIFLPGHTRGSVVVFDEKTGTLFSGDNISNSLWIQFPQSEDVEKFCLHLDKLKAYPIQQIVSSHSENIWPPELICILQDGIRQISLEKSRVFIHPRTGVESRLFKYPVEGVRGMKNLYIVFDHHRFARTAKMDSSSPMADMTVITANDA